MRNIKSLFSGIKEGMQEFGHTITAVVNFVLLTVVFVFGVGLISVISKVAKKKFLDKDLKKDAKTYWEKASIGGEKKKEEYTKPF